MAEDKKFREAFRYIKQDNKRRVRSTNFAYALD
jgi:hypothetical protein